MLASMKTKNMKLAAILSVITAAMITRTKDIRGIGKYLSPINFEDYDQLKLYMFIGNTAVPWFIVTFALTVLYVTILYTGTKMSYKKYHIN